MWYTIRVPKKPEPARRAASQLPTPDTQGKRVPAIFYRTQAHGEPVREWLKGLSADDRKRIGEDIKTVEFGWPIGMPVCKPLSDGIYEEVEAVAIKRVLAWQLEQAMREQQKTKRAMAKQLHTSRSQLDRLLDPRNVSVTLDTVARAAKALGKRLIIRVTDAKRSSS